MYMYIRRYVYQDHFTTLRIHRPRRRVFELYKSCRSALIWHFVWPDSGRSNTVHGIGSFSYSEFCLLMMIAFCWSLAQSSAESPAGHCYTFFALSGSLACLTGWWWGIFYSYFLFRISCSRDGILEFLIIVDRGYRTESLESQSCHSLACIHIDNFLFLFPRQFRSLSSHAWRFSCTGTRW